MGILGEIGKGSGFCKPLYTRYIVWRLTDKNAKAYG